MTRTVSDEISLFLQQLQALSPKLTVTEVCPYAYVVAPAATPYRRDASIPLTFTGLTHGNEGVGVAIFNALLAYLHTCPTALSFPLGLALGNVQAARLGQRFIDKDLNRSFGINSRTSHGPTYSEERRAEELSPFLKCSRHLIDFHQTILPNAEPFFIFPYQRSSYRFARRIYPEQAIITHWGGRFSREGMCVDEFVNSHGGTGITIETGRAGFDPYQIGYGYFIAMQAMRVIASDHSLGAAGAELPLTPGPLFTWAHTQPFPQGEAAPLRPGLFNFLEVAAGDELGIVGGAPLLAPVAGKLLFPKYVPLGTPCHQLPTELFRIVKPITEDQLPTNT